MKKQNLEENENIFEEVSEDELKNLSEKLIERNRHIYEELAK